MLRNTVQHYLYWKQNIRNEIGNFLKLFIIIVYSIVPFGVIEVIRQQFFSSTEFFLSLMFWVVVILLIIYWMPNKKELIEWKKTHSTF